MQIVQLPLFAHIRSFYLLAPVLLLDKALALLNLLQILVDSLQNLPSLLHILTVIDA